MAAKSELLSGSWKPLTNVEINEYFSGKGFKGYGGTFAKDNLPKKIKANTSYIVNFDDAGQPGTHWVAVINQPKNVLYYDSFGGHVPEDVLKFMRTGKKKMLRSDIQIQDPDSVLCGYYCISTIERLSEGESFTDILFDYSRNTKANEKKIKNEFSEK